MRKERGREEAREKERETFSREQKQSTPCCSSETTELKEEEEHEVQHQQVTMSPRLELPNRLIIEKAKAANGAGCSIMREASLLHRRKKRLNSFHSSKGSRNGRAKELIAKDKGVI